MEKSREKGLRKQIDAYVKGQLEEAEIEELWNEFAKNPELLDILEIEVHVKEIIKRETLPEPKSAETFTLPWWTWHAAAAATIAVIALVQLFSVDTPTQMKQFVVHEISPAEIETSDVVRAKELHITTADSLLNLGFKAVLSGDDKRALDLFEELILEHNEEPYASKAFLNKGIVLYNNEEYEPALIAFDSVINRGADNRMIIEKAYWYSGNALLNLDQLEEGRQTVFKAYQMDGMFRNQAFRLLKKLNDDLGNSNIEGFESTELN